MVIFLKELGILLSLISVGFFVWLGNHLHTLGMMDKGIYLIGSLLWVFVACVFCKMGYDILRGKGKNQVVKDNN